LNWLILSTAATVTGSQMLYCNWDLSTGLSIWWDVCNPISWLGWWSGVVVSALASISEVNQRRARLVLRWATVSGFSSLARHLFRYVTNQPRKANSAVHPSGVGKWVPASAWKAKAGMVHSVSGCTWGVQVKLWDSLRTHAISECLRGVFTRRCCINPQYKVYLTLPYLLWLWLIIYKCLLQIDRSLLQQLQCLRLSDWWWWW